MIDIVLADEVLTPDSSRFWEASQWKPGGAQPSFDKQFVRDYLESIHWNKQAPAPVFRTTWSDVHSTNTLKHFGD